MLRSGRPLALDCVSFCVCVSRGRLSRRSKVWAWDSSVLVASNKALNFLSGGSPMVSPSPDDEKAWES